MLVKDLIKKLKQVDGDRTVWLVDDGVCYDFNGLSYDDLNDIQLCRTGEDVEA